MKVFIVNYRGTIYGVFDSKDKAEAFLENSWIPADISVHDIQIIERAVQ